MRRISSTWRKYSIASCLIVKWSTWCAGRIMDWMMSLESLGRIWSVTMWKIKSGSFIDDARRSQEHLDAGFDHWNWIYPWGRYHCWIIGSARAVLSTVALVLGRTFWKVVHWRRAISHHGSNGWLVIWKEWYVYRRFVYSLPLEWNEAWTIESSQWVLHQRRLFAVSSPIIETLKVRCYSRKVCSLRTRN